MIGSLRLGMIHTCNILSSTQDQKLFFEFGSSVFTEGVLLIGETSEASGTIKEIVLESGSWTVGNATGYLILSNVQRAFKTGENISDDNGGNATVSRPTEPMTNGVGTPQLTTTSASYPCRFSRATNTRFGGIQSFNSGDYIVSEPTLFLPAEAVIQEGDIVTSYARGYTGPYKVMHVETLYELFVNANGECEINHLEVGLSVVKKRS